MPRKKLIGMVSKSAHSAAHRAAIQRAGLKVEDLGGNPKSIPERIDLLICRTASCSHKASALCFAWGKKDKNKDMLLVSNSLKQAVGFCEAYGLPSAPMASPRLDTIAGAARAVLGNLGFFRIGMVDALSDNELLGISEKVGVNTEMWILPKLLLQALATLRGANLGTQKRRMSDMHKFFSGSCYTEPGTPSDAVLCRNEAIRDAIEASESLQIQLRLGAYKQRLLIPPEPEDDVSGVDDDCEGVIGEEAPVPEAAAPPPLPEAREETDEEIVDRWHRKVLELPALMDRAEDAKPPEPPKELTPIQEVEEAIRLLHSYMKDASVSKIMLTQESAELTYEIRESGSFNFGKA